MMLLENKFGVGDFVFLRTDASEFLRIVTGLLISQGNQISYRLSCGSVESWHSEFELETKVKAIADEDII